MKIAFFEVAKAEQSIFLGSFGNDEVYFFEEELNEKNIEAARDVDILCVFIGQQIDKNIIDRIPNLKLIVTRSTGYDHIDHEYAKTKGIHVSNVPAYGSSTVAEFTFALLLTLSRKIREVSHALKDNGDFRTPEEAQGFDLDQKTLGVIGTGKIGKNVISIAKGFNMNVLAYDLFPDTEFAKENNFTYKTLSEVLSESDIITLHAPYTKENHHLINEENISMMKKGAYIINTARGELVDTAALEVALRDKIIAGAGLDVMEGEKEFKKGQPIPMLDMPNVIITPHVAFDTVEARARITETTLENIKSFVSGAPVNLVQ
jgi:D-lactate dehydrogenase